MPVIVAEGDSFRMTTVRRGLPQNKIESYNIRNKNIGTVIDDMKSLLENPAT